MDAFEEAVEEALGRCRHGGVLLAAVSGGADSTAMLVAVAALRSRFGFVLHCLHVDHGIRSDAECAADAAFVVSLCDSLDVPCSVVRIGSGVIRAAAEAEGSGLEAAAREARRAAWTEEARKLGAGRVLVAHTADDLLETALIRFLRGAGPAGLAAMTEERGLVFRPLLSRTRADVLEYLARKMMTFRTDSTNADTAYFRNRVRLKLVPFLDADFPHWRGAVAALAETQSEAAAFIAEESAARVSWQGGERLSTDEASFFAQNEIVRQEAVFAAVDRLAAAREGADAGLSADGVPRRKAEPRRAALRSFTGGLAAAADLGAYRAWRADGRVLVERWRAPGARRGFAVVVRSPGDYRAGSFIVCAREKVASGVGFSARLPFVLRNAAAGDRIGSGGRVVRMARIAADWGASRMDEIVVAEDSLGIAAVFYPGSGGVKLMLRDGRNEGPGYADFVFFSILIQRGYYA